MHFHRVKSAYMFCFSYASQMKYINNLTVYSSLHLERFIAKIKSVADTAIKISQLK